LKVILLAGRFGVSYKLIWFLEFSVKINVKNEKTCKSF
jgi:hypothetical protein